jgi:hypothetical protein
MKQGNKPKRRSGNAKYPIVKQSLRIAGEKELRCRNLFEAAENVCHSVEGDSKSKKLSNDLTSFCEYPTDFRAMQSKALQPQVDGGMFQWPQQRGLLTSHCANSQC